ncbi:CBS domain-containing protein [Streptomyces sp. AK02-04a]|uniref:CBS domain-containing protein n=1 Tax=Streptomyces sp. AK02-04a TaxID=3028649 RepID=UPI0039F5880B
MEALPSPLPATTALTDAADLLSLSGHEALPVVDDTGEYLGVVTAQAVAEALAEQPDVTPSAVGRLAEPPAAVTADQSLAQALHVLLSAAGTGLPVLDAKGVRRRAPAHRSRPSRVGAALGRPGREPVALLPPC